MGKSKKRSIDTHFWNDTYTGGLDRDEKYLYIYLITNPLTNMLGIYEIRVERMCFDTGLDEESVREALSKFEKDGKVKYVDGYIILVNFVKNQNYNRNMIKSAVTDMKDLPDSIKQTSFFRRILSWFKEHYPNLEAVKDVTIPNKQMELGEAVNAGNQEQEEEDNKSKSSTKKPSQKWRTKGVPIPEPLRTDDFKEVIEQYWKHLQSTFKKRPSIPMVQGKFRRLIELQSQGHDPVKVVQQTINDGNKKFYAITDKQFESNNKTNEQEDPKQKAKRHYEQTQRIMQENESSLTGN
ncbi:hypothetical protein [Fodinibius sp. SL11]|uniref:hypothetical protein n=1 Tax=Fodinibius sp. SL11 TaxID=3425690 RepID=UPI003F881B94